MSTPLHLPHRTSRFLVVDGTFIQHPFLPLDGSAKIANVHAMIGLMRDDGAAFMSTPVSIVVRLPLLPLPNISQKNDDVAAAVQSVGLPPVIANSTLFPVANGAINATENVFNVTARATTDALFCCLDQASAFSAIKHNLFKDVWFYEFNRSYQTPGFDPNAPHCDAPVDADHPAGNPDGEYYK